MNIAHGEEVGANRNESDTEVSGGRVYTRAIMSHQVRAVIYQGNIDGYSYYSRWAASWEQTLD